MGAEDVCYLDFDCQYGLKYQSKQLYYTYLGSIASLFISLCLRFLSLFLVFLLLPL